MQAAVEQPTKKPTTFLTAAEVRRLHRAARQESKDGRSWKVTPTAKQVVNATTTH